MEPKPLTIRSWPQAILHLDADAFFASCEQAIHPGLRRKPVITGKERGIVAALSYEAKARGVRRGMRLFEVRKVCPDAVIVPSDYETYSLFSVRMFDILRRFSPDVEEYSIDEAFADVTGLRRSLHGSYGMIAQKIQKTVETELGITVSVGVSLSKVLAKIGSKLRKPHGLTMIPGGDIHIYLERLPVEKVWGIGPNTSAYLGKLGIRTALQFARKDEAFIKRYFSKPYLEIWHELNGRSVYPVVRESKSSYQSISKTRTFTPPSDDKDFVFAQLSKNLENACIKLRRHKLAATRLIVFLRRQDFREAGLEMKLNRPTAYPSELFGLLREGFDFLFRPQGLYRLTGVVLGGLVPEDRVQYTLFDDVTMIEKMSRIYSGVDRLSARYGKHTVQHGTSLPAKVQVRHEGERGDVAKRKTSLFSGESKRRRLGLPMWHMKV
ncbi:MAG TPA: DNA polymerase IV [Nitrospirae bacterium]|nr:DNA polymerase IV [bacterium BMS3Abin07]GBE31633.1 DNA polymerase IV [bacterium BMS3Bbin05]HDO21323.1 DNA polymerase IV [Nitrospirota bacterium]HDO34694.1 DNA polymerase IV [Nitrospirota bacterium]HDZ87408.1 DNA polymerase IV [Nitrospirota bacterium]